MAKYLLVFYGGGMPETPAAQARVLKQWETWYGKLGPAVVDAGNPFSGCLLYTSPSPRDLSTSRMPSSA